MTSKILKKFHDTSRESLASGESVNIKLASDSFMFSSELYYKQLLALGKAAAAGKMCFNSINIKDSSTPINCSISDKTKLHEEDAGNQENDNDETEDEEQDNYNEVRTRNCVA